MARKAKRAATRRRRGVKLVPKKLIVDEVKKTRLEKQREKQREMLMKRKSNLVELNGMVKTLIKVKSYCQMEQTLRVVCVFDPYFKYLEPNTVKRRKMLRRLFNFDLKLEDKEVVKEIHSVYKSMIKYNLKKQTK